MFSTNSANEGNASEDSTVINCDPCRFEGTETEAKAFCYDCDEFLCQNCTQSHRKFQAFRLHSILRGDSMPRTRVETTSKLALKLCDDHKLSEVQFYCCGHQSVFCELCKTSKHASCETKRIHDIAEEEDRAKLNDAVCENENIKGVFGQLKTMEIEKIDRLKTFTGRNKTQLKYVMQKLNECFDKLENEVAENEGQVKRFVDDLKENVAIYTDAINHIASLQEPINYVSKSNDSVAVFAATTKLKRMCAEYTKVKNIIWFNPTKITSEQTYMKVMEVQQMCDTVCKKMNAEESGVSEAATAEFADINHHLLNANSDVVGNNEQTLKTNTSEQTCTNGKNKKRNRNKKRNAQPV